MIHLFATVSLSHEVRFRWTASSYSMLVIHPLFIILGQAL